MPEHLTLPDVLAPDSIEILTPSELAALGDAERVDFDESDAIADVLAGTTCDDGDDENDAPESDDDE